VAREALPDLSDVCLPAVPPGSAGKRFTTTIV